MSSGIVTLPLRSFSETITIETGDIVVMYTDGITESINAKGEDFGEERLRMLISGNADLTAQEILMNIPDDVTTFAGDLPQFDNITLMVIKKG